MSILFSTCAIDCCVHCNEVYAACGKQYAAHTRCSAAHVCDGCKSWLRNAMRKCTDEALAGMLECSHRDVELKRCRACCLLGAIECCHNPATRRICVACGEALRKEVQHRERMQRHKVPSLVALCVRCITTDPELLLSVATALPVSAPLWSVLLEEAPTRRSQPAHTESKYRLLAKAFAKLT